ncbi:hypothetical protein TRFO_35589 [Tritrichomonas foetus]|uniref:Uncharacterized protein n=1 Tax=Tritrichomonas foetus TaxID=1144522 RepID=A0A1J4JKH9_9EUKA|nr:hypothetical protein TRFO_35589 [Tritrichomonas foetus]|eukprot:OHS98059.1 hypothetical protein TRFO_35589 [Tritrichomonas foetus]
MTSLMGRPKEIAGFRSIVVILDTGPKHFPLGESGRLKVKIKSKRRSRLKDYGRVLGHQKFNDELPPDKPKTGSSSPQEHLHRPNQSNQRIGQNAFLQDEDFISTVDGQPNEVNDLNPHVDDHLSVIDRSTRLNCGNNEVGVLDSHFNMGFFVNIISHIGNYQFNHVNDTPTPGEVVNANDKLDQVVTEEIFNKVLHSFMCE